MDHSTAVAVGAAVAVDAAVTGMKQPVQVRQDAVAVLAGRRLGSRTDRLGSETQTNVRGKSGFRVTPRRKCSLTSCCGGPR